MLLIANVRQKPEATSMHYIKLFSAAVIDSTYVHLNIERISFMQLRVTLAQNKKTVKLYGIKCKNTAIINKLILLNSQQYHALLFPCT
jgi:mevalonate pyrophosphate decarboxylase